MNVTPKRRWSRYSLRALLVLVTIACVGFGWLGIKVRTKQRERETVNAIKQLRGAVIYDYQFDSTDRFDFDATPPGPKWLRVLLGDDILANVVNVQTHNLPLTDADLARIASLSQLNFLGLNGTNVTDLGLKHLHGLTHLEHLYLYRTAVTEMGCQELKKALPNLKIYR